MQIAHGEPLNLPAIRQTTGSLEMRQTCLNGVSLSHRWRRRRRLLVERAPRLYRTQTTTYWECYSTLQEWMAGGHNQVISGQRAAEA